MPLMDPSQPFRPPAGVDCFLQLLPILPSLPRFSALTLLFPRQFPLLCWCTIFIWRFNTLFQGLPLPGSPHGCQNCVPKCHTIPEQAEINPSELRTTNLGALPPNSHQTSQGFIQETKGTLSSERTLTVLSRCDSACGLGSSASLGWWSKSSSICFPEKFQPWKLYGWWGLHKVKCRGPSFQKSLLPWPSFSKSFWEAHGWKERAENFLLIMTYRIRGKIINSDQTFIKYCIEEKKKQSFFPSCVRK